MKNTLPLPVWTLAAPVAAWLTYLSQSLFDGGAFTLLMAVVLIGAIMAAVHLAEVVAHRVGEPFGTLLLAVAVTVIEVSLIVSLMVAGGPETTTLARDTVFAAVMIILTLMIGLCLLLGGARHKEQLFVKYGVSAALVTLTAISVLTLVLPNYTTSIAGPVYSSSQLTSWRWCLWCSTARLCWCRPSGTGTISCLPLVQRGSAKGCMISCYRSCIL